MLKSWLFAALLACVFLSGLNPAGAADNKANQSKTKVGQEQSRPLLAMVGIEG